MPEARVSSPPQEREEGEPPAPGVGAGRAGMLVSFHTGALEHVLLQQDARMRTGAQRPIWCGFSPVPFSQSGVEGAEQALEKLPASQKLPPLPLFTENEHGVRDVHKWVGMCREARSTELLGRLPPGLPWIAFHDLFFPFVLRPGEGK